MAFQASVLISAFNRRRQLLECLESILACDGRDFELLVVDDGSTDDSWLCLQDFKLRHPDRVIHLLRNETNRGYSGGRNRAVPHAQGEYICMTDSDCTVDPQWLTSLIARLKETQADAVSGLVLDHPPRNYAELAYNGIARIGSNATPGRPVVGGNLGIRADVLKLHPFDESLVFGGEDDDLGWRLRALNQPLDFAPLARVFHHHPMDVRNYLKAGYRQGKASASIWYKHGLFLGRDVWLLTLSLVTLPAIFFFSWGWMLPVLFFGLHYLSLVFNQWYLRNKPLGIALWVSPLELAYYFCKIAGVYKTLTRIALGMKPALIASKRQWRQNRTIGKS